MLRWLLGRFRTRPEVARDDAPDNDDVVLDDFGGSRIPLIPLVELAIKERGTFHPETAERLAKLIAAHQNAGRIAQTICKAGTQLTKQEMRERGLEPWPPLSHEILAMMTDAGRTDPWGALDFVVGRTIGRAYSIRHRQGHQEDGTAFAFPTFRLEVGKEACREAKLLAKRAHPIDEEPILPLTDCPVHYCECRVRLISRRRRSRR